MTVSPHQHTRLKYNLDSLKLKLSALKLSRILTRHAYDPNQPRVPAGHPDGGQWTDTGGASGGSSTSRISIGSNSGSRDSIFNDAAREEVAGQGNHPNKPKINALKFDTYRLEEDEGKKTGRGRGRTHTIARHVSKKKALLVNRVKSDQLLLRVLSKLPRVKKFAKTYATTKFFEASSFVSPPSANKLVRSTLARHESIVRLVASGEITTSRTLNARFPSKTGIVAYARSLRKPRMTNAYGVRVVIYHDPTSEFGFRVLTAFPTR